MVSDEKFFAVYREKFLPTYANFVALSLKKSQQILIEESNILSHLAQFNNPKLNTAKRQENLDKAYNHLMRATMDLHKLVWASLVDLLRVYRDDSRMRICLNMSSMDFSNKYDLFIQKAIEAKQHELMNIGDDVDGTIKLFDDANQIGFELYKAVDFIKEESMKRWTRIFTIKEFFWGILVGVIASILASFFFTYMTHGVTPPVSTNIVKGMPAAVAPAIPASGATASPFPDVPDAKQAPDGKWYVKRNGQFFEVIP